MGEDRVRDRGRGRGCEQVGIGARVRGGEGNRFTLQGVIL